MGRQVEDLEVDHGEQWIGGGTENENASPITS